MKAAPRALAATALLGLASCGSHPTLKAPVHSPLQTQWEQVPEGVTQSDSASRSWWLLLVTGATWIVLSIIVFRFDYSSVQAISVLFGVLVLAGAAALLHGVAEIVGAFRLRDLAA